MKAKQLSIAAAAIAALVHFMPGGAFSQNEPIRIAGTFPLTGNVAAFGQMARNGAELAVAEANVSGGILGRQVAFDVEDNRCNPTEGVKIVTQMLSGKRYAALFDGLCSSLILAIMPVAERMRVPLMVATASATSISDKAGVGGHRWTYKFNPTDSTMAKAMVDWLNGQKLADRIAFLGEDTDFGRSGAEGFKGALKDLGKSLVTEDYYQQGTADFSAALTKLRALNPSVIGIYALSGDQQNIVNQMRTFNFRAPLTGRLQTDVIPKEVLESGFLDGTTSVQPYSPEIDTPQNKAFVSAFQAKYNVVPNSIAYSSYEAMRVLLDSIARAGDPDPAKVRDAIGKSKFPSLLGGTVEFDDHNLAHNFAVILQIQGGKPKVAGLTKT